MRTEYFLTCMICGYQEIVDRAMFLKKKKIWLFYEEGMVCPKCKRFPDAVKQMMQYRKKGDQKK